MAVTMKETLTGMPNMLSTLATTMDRPEMEPSTSLLGSMK
jgi:hypothetical protein